MGSNKKGEIKEILSKKYISEAYYKKSFEVYYENWINVSEEFGLII